MCIRKKVLWCILNKIRCPTWRRFTPFIHSSIVPVNHVVTMECFINKDCSDSCVLYIPKENIGNVTRVVGDGVVTRCFAHVMFST